MAGTPPWDLESVLILKAVGTFGLGGLGLVIWLVSRSPKGVLLLSRGCARWVLGWPTCSVPQRGLKRQEAIEQAAPDAWTC